MNSTWVELNTRRLERNLCALRAALAPRTEIMFVVKANAYGHGLREVTDMAWRQGVRSFVVTHTAEGTALRRQHPSARILLSGVTPPEDVATLLRHRLIPVIVGDAHARSLAQAIRRVSPGACLEVHAKIDTGMGRLGFFWEEACEQLPRLARLPELRITGLCTHLASASATDVSFSSMQVARFQKVVKRCRTAALPIQCRHVSNSAGILQNPSWDFDAVRVGILLYGYARPAGQRPRVRTYPFLQWKTRVVQVKKVPGGWPISYDGTYITPRPTWIAVLPAGYADGLPRLLSNRGWVLVNGRRCPIIGRVTMNFTMIDLGPRHPIRLEEEAVLIGEQRNVSVWADEIAEWCQTIPYEILTGIRTDERRII